MAARKHFILDKIQISRTNGFEWPQPIPATAEFDLDPLPRFSIEFEVPFIFFSSDWTKKLSIETTTGIKATGFATAKIFVDNHSMHRAKVSFFLGFAPFTTLLGNKKVTRIDFGVVNFPNFLGGKSIRRGKGQYSLGAAKTQFRGFEIQLTERLYLPRTSHRNQDGYSVTHSGVLQRNDRKPFGATDAQQILWRFRWFLSFLRGVQCGFAPVHATVGDQRLVFRWGSDYVAPEPAGSDNWLPWVGVGEVIANLFPEFDRICEDPAWDDFLYVAIDLYTNANRSAVHVALVLAQAVLEVLSQKILSKEKLRKTESNAKRRLQYLLDAFEIERATPLALASLQQFSDDGPTVLVRLRSELVAHVKRYPQVSTDVQVQAMFLSRWYIEVILLKQLGYSGEYFDRVSNNVTNFD